MVYKCKDHFIHNCGRNAAKQGQRFCRKRWDLYDITFKKVCGYARKKLPFPTWRVKLKEILKTNKSGDCLMLTREHFSSELCQTKHINSNPWTVPAVKLAKSYWLFFFCLTSLEQKKYFLVIGKSQKPIFSSRKYQITLCTPYSRQKAWMTRDLFAEWFRKLDERFQTRQNKNNIWSGNFIRPI